MPWMWIITIGLGLLVVGNIPFIGNLTGIGGLSQAVGGVTNILRDIVATLKPYALLIVLAVVFRALVMRIAERVADRIEQILLGIWGAALGILTALVLGANSFLLGPLAHWVWLHEWGAIVLIGLSGLTLALLEGGFGRRIGQGLLILAMAIGAGSIIGGWTMEHFDLIRVQRFETRVEQGAMLMDPRTAVKVKGGESISFTVYGMYRVAGGKQYFPYGDIGELVNNEPRGSIYFAVERPDGRYVPVPIQKFQKSRLPSYLAGEIRVPEKVDGILRIGINDQGAVLQQAEGRYTVKMTVDFTKGFLGRMVGLQSFWAPMTLLAFVAFLAVAYAVLLSAIAKFNNGGVGFLVKVGLAVFIALVGAVTVRAASTVAGVTPLHELSKSIGLAVPGAAVRAPAPPQQLSVALKGSGPNDWVEIADRLPATGVLQWETRKARDVRVKFEDGSDAPLHGDLKGRGNVRAVNGQGVLVVKWRE